MENLLDDIDDLVTPGLSTETPDWCVNCQALRQELKQLKEEHCQNFSRLKQKIINTDLLIKKFKTKCDDYDVQCKKTEEANKRADKYQRQCEILETQLKAALLDTEPLRKKVTSLEEELNVKKNDAQLLSDKLIATETAQKQYEHLARSNSVSVDQLEAEKKELTKKLKQLEAAKTNKDTAKELKNEIAVLKKENSSLRKDNLNLQKTEERLEKRLQLANKSIDELNKSLKEKALGSSPTIRRRLSPIKSPFHSPRLGRYKSPNKSSRSPSVSQCKTVVTQPSPAANQSSPGVKKLDMKETSSLDDTDDDDDDGGGSVCSVTWTFSPLTNCISPLPPSPACFHNQNDMDGDDSDIADDLEQQLLHDDDDYVDDGDNCVVDKREENDELEANSASVHSSAHVHENQHSMVENNEKTVHNDFDEIDHAGNEIVLNSSKTEDIHGKEKEMVLQTSDEKSAQYSDALTVLKMDKDDSVAKQKQLDEVKENSENVNLSVKERIANSMEVLSPSALTKVSDPLAKRGELGVLKSDSTNVECDQDARTFSKDSSPLRKREELISMNRNSSPLKNQHGKQTNSDIVKIITKSPLKCRDDSVPLKKDSCLFKKQESIECDSDSVKTTTRAPTVRRSMRIKSKRDSETSEAEFDGNSEYKRTHTELADSTNEVDEHIENSGQSKKTEVSNAVDLIVPANDENKLVKVRHSIDSYNKTNRNSEQSEKKIKPEVSSIGEEVCDVSSDELKRKIENSKTALTSPETKSSLSDKINIEKDSKVNAGNLTLKSGYISGPHDQLSESEEKAEIEVRKEMQTEVVIPKPVPGQSCLVRQKAVCSKDGHSHLFDELQAVRGMKTKNGASSALPDKYKAKFGAHKFIPFQRSSVGTLSNEIEDFNYLNEYKPLDRGLTESQNVVTQVQLSHKQRKILRRKMRKNVKYKDLDSEQCSEADSFEPTESDKVDFSRALSEYSSNIESVTDETKMTKGTLSKTETSPAGKSSSPKTESSNVSSNIDDLIMHSKQCSDKNNILDTSKDIEEYDNDDSAQTATDEHELNISSVQENNLSHVEVSKEFEQEMMTELDSGDGIGYENNKICDEDISDGTENSGNVKIFVNDKLEECDEIDSKKADTDELGDKNVPSRQLSTGFSFNSVSLERASSSDSVVSFRNSPARLFMLESGSCDTIHESIDENYNPVSVKDENDDDGVNGESGYGGINNDDKADGTDDDNTIDKNTDMDESDSNIIFGVDDLIGAESEEICDTVANECLTSHVETPNKNNADNTDVHTNTSIDDNKNFEIFASYSEPSSGIHSEVKPKGDDLLNGSSSGKLLRQPLNDDNDIPRAHTTSFNIFGRESPFSGLMLSGFDFCDPISPLPPSPVNGLEECDYDDADDDSAVVDDNDDDKHGNKVDDENSAFTSSNGLVCNNIIELDIRNKSEENDEIKGEVVLGNDENMTVDEMVDKTSVKALTAHDDSVSKLTSQNRALINATETGEKTLKKEAGVVDMDKPVKKENEISNNAQFDVSVVRHIKVEQLKMSPLPGIISPVKSPSTRQNTKPVTNKDMKVEEQVKIERNNEHCDTSLNIENENRLSRTISKAAISKSIISSSAKSGVKNMRSSTAKKTSPVKADVLQKLRNRKSMDLGPAGNSALAEKILKKRADISKKKRQNVTEKGSFSNLVKEKVMSGDKSKNTHGINTRDKVKTSTAHNDDPRYAENAVANTESIGEAALRSEPMTVKETTKENESRTDAGELVVGIVDEKGDNSVLEELPTGHDNLAFKRKSRVAHRANMQPLRPQKIQIIEAPSLPPPQVSGRKRRSTEAVNKETTEKNKSKKSTFKRQKTESCVNKDDTRRMQAFLKSTETADSFVTKVTEIHGAEHAGNLILLSCLECIGRVMTDPLDVVFENCVTDAYMDIHTDFPFLSDVEKRAVNLINYLLENKHIDKDQTMRCSWDTVLCRNLTVNVVGKMAQCRLFIALCALQGDLELARVMLYQIVTCTYINFIYFLVPVVSVWPEILRKQSTDRPDMVVTHGLTLVLEELITERLLAAQDELSKKILLILKKLCNWSGTTGNSEWVLKTLLIKLHTCTDDETSNDCAIFELMKALNLLCASRSWIWVKTNFIERHGLQTAVNKYTAKLIMQPLSSKYMCALLKVTSHVFNVHAVTIQERDYQRVIRHWLLPVLRHKNGNHEVQQCCLETLIELSPLYPTCLGMIHKWFDESKSNLSTELAARLEDLRIQYKQKFGLVCKPFVLS